MVSEKCGFLVKDLKTRICVEKLIIELIVSLIFVIKNFFLLIFYPYKTMRRLSLNFDLYQLVIIFLLVFSYFKFAYFLKDKPFPATITFYVFLINFLDNVFFFYFLGRIFEKQAVFSSLIFTFSHSLFPTLVWFGTTSVLYILLPPPRTTSILGQGFS
ncbi:MAG: hypothetical protein ACK4FL_03350, partial [Microgenomates group bacterium]